MVWRSAYEAPVSLEAEPPYRVWEMVNFSPVVRF